MKIGERLELVLSLKRNFIISSLFVFSSVTASAQSNLDFEQGLTSWKTSGNKKNVSIDLENSHNGQFCVRIEGDAGVFQRLPVRPLSILQFDCYIKSGTEAAKGYSFVRFYDSKNRVLLEYKNNPSDSVKYQQTGNYTEAPALADHMEIGVERNDVGSGYIYADDFSIQTQVGEPKTMHAPTIDLARYMRPFWRSDTIFNETVLLFSVDGKPAQGKLLYQPDHVLSIKSFDLHATYKEGVDFNLNGNVISRAQTSSMSYRADTSFDKNDLAWYNLESQWVVVTYTHHDKWNGTVPDYKGEELPNTINKLKTKAPLKIAAFGMSITRGMDVSGYDTVPPYMPTYVDLFVRQLRKAYHYSSITLYNAGLPGATVDWGAEYAEKYVNPLKPDLVIIDFGMNDFWRLTSPEFEDYIKTIMKKIRSANPKVEFLLLSNMKFDPGYVLDSDKNKSFYQTNLEGYSKVLKQMETKGVINLDMYSISDEIYRLKKAKDCIANPLHPNDYLARWYAQGMAALLIEPRFSGLK